MSDLISHGPYSHIDRELEIAACLDCLRSRISEAQAQRDDNWRKLCAAGSRISVLEKAGTRLYDDVNAIAKGRRVPLVIDALLDALNRYDRTTGT